MKKQQFEISIDHEMLKGAKQSFDTCLRMAVKRAIGTGSYEGSATVKIHFEILKCIDRDTGEEFMTPEIKFKAGYSVPMKDGIDGTIIEKSRIMQGNDGQLMLVNDQVSMDELLAEDDEKGQNG